MKIRTVLVFVLMAVAVVAQDNPSSPCEVPNSTGDRIRVSPGERQALISLYQATNGEHWKNKEGWLGEPGTECEWYGVVCDNKGVFMLRLDENNLGGALPRVIGDFPHLYSLGLWGNDLGGAVPEDIATLPRLESLDLLGNHFTEVLPEPLVRRWLSGKLRIVAEDALFTPISEIDFDYDASELLCLQHRVVVRSDGSVTLFSTRCRNATPDDRTTFCEVKQGRVYYDFAKLANFIEKNGFFEFQSKYSVNSTGGALAWLRVTRNGKAHEVVEYGGGGPLELWTIQQSIEGVASSVDWEKTSEQPECPKWRR